MTFIQNLTLALVSDTDKLSIAKMPPPVSQRTHWYLYRREALIKSIPQLQTYA